MNRTRNSIKIVQFCGFFVLKSGFVIFHLLCCIAPVSSNHHCIDPIVFVFVFESRQRGIKELEQANHNAQEVGRSAVFRVACETHLWNDCKDGLFFAVHMCGCNSRR